MVMETLYKNMMTPCKKYFPTAIVSVGMLFLPSCFLEKNIEYPVVPNVLAVNCFFSPQKTWAVEVTKTMSYADTSRYFETIKNAKVEVYDENGLRADSLTFEGGVYKGKTFPKPGLRYVLKASAPGFPDVQASDATPPLPAYKMEWAKQPDRRVDVFGDTLEVTRLNLDFIWQDAPGQKNYYYYSAYHHNEYVYGGQKYSYDQWLTDFQLYQPSTVETITHTKRVFSDAAFNGKNFKLRGYIMPWKDGKSPKAEFKMGVLSESYFRYLTEGSSTVGNEDGFFSSNAPFYSNVQGGLGIFAGYDWRYFEFDD